MALIGTGIASRGLYANETTVPIERITEPSGASRDYTRRNLFVESTAASSENDAEWGGIEKLHIQYSQSDNEKQATDKLRKAVKAGQDTYDNSMNKVSDNKTRDTLKTALDDANTILAENDGNESIDVKIYDAKTKAISGAVDSVNTSMTAWQQAQAAKRNASNGYSGSSSLGTTVPVGEMQQWAHDYMIANGYSEADWSAATWIINHESGWNPQATNPSSGAFGICQSLPGSKMASAGADWQTNYQTQFKWFLSYVDGRYSGAQNAYNFWQVHHYY